jgi:hypothetical protein
VKKIPTVFRRNPEDPRHVTGEVHPECQWVLDGEGVATRKYDGTCVMRGGDGSWWARREVKAGKTPPPGYEPVEIDEFTGKTMGWEPAEQSSFWKFLHEAIPTIKRPERWAFPVDTYELIGPKINGNPENVPGHCLVRHHDAIRVTLPVKLDYETCKQTLLRLSRVGWEGIVWHHPDGRMAKLKGRDFASDKASDRGRP